MENGLRLVRLLLTKLGGLPEESNGSTAFFVLLAPVHAATLVWDGQSRVVDVEAAENEPLLGMNQMAGHDLRIRIQKGGAVELTAIP